MNDRPNTVNDILSDDYRDSKLEAGRKSYRDTREPEHPLLASFAMAALIAGMLTAPVWLPKLGAFLGIGG